MTRTQAGTNTSLSTLTNVTIVLLWAVSFVARRSNSIHSPPFPPGRMHSESYHIIEYKKDANTMKSAMLYFMLFARVALYVVLVGEILLAEQCWNRFYIWILMAEKLSDEKYQEIYLMCRFHVRQNNF